MEYEMPSYFCFVKRLSNENGMCNNVIMSAKRNNVHTINSIQYIIVEYINTYYLRLLSKDIIIQKLIGIILIMSRAQKQSSPLCTATDSLWDKNSADLGSSDPMAIRRPRSFRKAVDLGPIAPMVSIAIEVKLWLVGSPRYFSTFLSRLQLRPWPLGAIGPKSVAFLKDLGRRIVMELGEPRSTDFSGP